MLHYCDTPLWGLLGEDIPAELGIEQPSVFLAWMPQPVFPHHDDGRTGYVDQFSEFGLRVSVTVPPVFEPLHAGRLCPDERVADWGVSAVVSDGEEESCIGVLVHRDFFVSDSGGEWFRGHGFLISFRPVLWCRGFLP